MYHIKNESFIFNSTAFRRRLQCKNLYELLQKSNYIILVAGHTESRDMDLSKLKEKDIKVVINGRNCLDAERIKSMGILYHGSKEVKFQ